MNDAEKIEQIEKVLRQVWYSQWNDEYQDGKIWVADQIADILGIET